MYNGLPWPDEEFARVTVERDLQICNTLKDHPILWKILWGLAEARPALCYCSVLLRAALAVQVNRNYKCLLSIRRMVRNFELLTLFTTLLVYSTKMCFLFIHVTISLQLVTKINAFYLKA
jgi:hypothetical protein